MPGLSTWYSLFSFLGAGTDEGSSSNFPFLISDSARQLFHGHVLLAIQCGLNLHPKAVVAPLPVLMSTKIQAWSTQTLNATDMQKQSLGKAGRSMAVISVAEY